VELLLYLLSIVIAFVAGAIIGYVYGLEDTEDLKHRARLKNLEIF
jgi:uncharacterized protein YneF (UPF0154 family)